VRETRYANEEKARSLVSKEERGVCGVNGLRTWMVLREGVQNVKKTNNQKKITPTTPERKKKAPKKKQKKT